MAVICVAVATTKFLFDMCDRTVASVEILQVCGHAHVRSHVSPGMDYHKQ